MHEDEGQRGLLLDIVPPSNAPLVKKEIKARPKIQNVVQNDKQQIVVQNEVVPPSVKLSMTRRFTVAEKLRIISKYKETENASSTCR